MKKIAKSIIKGFDEIIDEKTKNKQYLNAYTVAIEQKESEPVEQKTEQIATITDVKTEPQNKTEGQPGDI